MTTVRQFGDELAEAARERLDVLSGRTVLGPVNVSFWAKQAITDQIAILTQKQVTDLGREEGAFEGGAVTSP